MSLVLPSLPAGHTVTAADYTSLMAAITQAYGIPLVVAADRSATLNNTTLQDITDFSTSVLANTTYRFDAVWHYSASTTADLKIGMVVPASASSRYEASGALPTDTAANGNFFNGSFTESVGTPVFGGCGVGTTMIARVSGHLIVAGTAGTFKFQFSQNTADAVNTTKIYLGSWVTLWPV